MRKILEAKERLTLERLLDCGISDYKDTIVIEAGEQVTYSYTTVSNSRYIFDINGKRYTSHMSNFNIVEVEEPKDSIEDTNKVGEIKPSTVVRKATEAGFKVENSIQANIVNNINGLNKSSITISGNQKTGEIPCINLPNIQVQKDFIQVVKNNTQLLEMEAVKTLYNYMLMNPMCVNCGSCKDACYNNQAYRQYPTKAIADLRTLYNLIKSPLETIGTIAQRTKNLRVVRLNGSGEIHNQAILDNYIKLAKLNPLTIYYTYTKNYKLLEGKRLPKNLIINVSQFGNMSIDMSKYSKNTNVFKTVTQLEFDTTKENKTVKKCINDCSNCNYCYTKKGYTILVPIHGSDANKATL